MFYTMIVEIPVRKHIASQFYVRSAVEVLATIFSQFNTVICIDENGNEIKTRVERVWIEAGKVWLKLTTNAKCVKLIIQLPIEKSL